MNKVMIIGRLGADPAMTATPAGNQVVTVSLATSRRYKDKAGDKKEVTEWHRCVFWNTSAELVSAYCKKGSQLFVEGRLETRKWTDDKNIERYTTEIVVERLEFLGSRGTGTGVPAPNDENAPAGDFFDEDIPF